MSQLVDAIQLVRDRVRMFYGPLTGELVRCPGEFGLGQVPGRTKPDSTTAMVCGFCSTGCSLNVHLREGQATNLTPNFDYPVNLGMACPKGWEALAPLDSPDRALAPLVRTQRGGPFHQVDWQEAADLFCKRMKGVIDEHGPESAAFLSTGQICTEEMAFLGAFAKFGMGMVEGDGNTRQCMATAVRAYKESFGFDAPPYSYEDFEESEVIVLIGSNLCIAHPILWQRVLQNRHDAEIVVIDPRRTETAMQAHRHVALNPKSDLVLYYGLAHLLVEQGLVNKGYVAASTSGFREFREHVKDFPPERVAAETGVSVAELESLARLFGSGKRVSFWWTMGVNQGHEATRTAQAIINLALMTGNIGKPGTGANSITGQCNAMGSRLFSNTTNLLGGHDFRNPGHREKVARILGIDPGRIPERESIAYDQILEGVREGRIRALWVICTNPAHSWIGREDFRELMDKLDFLVVQDLYATTETAQLADLVLPAAGWGEKDGTFINSERRIGLVKKVSRAPGEALSDFRIFRLLAQTWGCGEMFERWTDPEAVFEILQELSEGQPCDISGIGGYDQLDRAGGVQWPWPKNPEGREEKHAEGQNGEHGENRDGGAPTSDPPAQRRLFENGKFFTSDGRARFVFDQPAADPEPPCDEFPLRLLTGRGSSAQWHTQTRTKKSEVLRKLSPRENHLEIHPEDAAALGIESGGRVSVRSRRGEIELKAFVTATVPPGSVFIPMHEEATNRLTLAVFDPHSRQPSYKSCAVRVAPAQGEFEE